MKITVAMDNCLPFNARGPLVAEHGVAFVVEAGGRRILYDTGQSGAVVNNLAALGLPPASLDAIIISHGHYDHAGGLAAVLAAARPEVEVLLHTKAFTARCSARPGGTVSTGIPVAEAALKALGGRWSQTDLPCEVAPGLWFSGSIPRVSPFETGDPRLLLPGADAPRPDPMEDDTVLYGRGAQGLVVIGGCTHAGLVNAVCHGFAVTGCDRLQAFIGGTHLGPATPDQQERTLAQLEAWAPDLIAANHCTGFAVMSRLRHLFGARFRTAFVGETLEIASCPAPAFVE
ncbi:ribonuclease BN [mine drainage metagenome]|uniref:Ribonuclease BN n=1 Tax=mine drainage metagenome TaxID=410659 RepID=A0A1J5RSP2_9ZZZZ